MWNTPQKWPHSHLKLHFVAKERKYDELSLAEFCAGYMSILKICKTSHREARIAHLEELMYHATTKPWKCILNYHAACLLEIERGNLKWGDNFQLHGLQSTTLNNPNTNVRTQGGFSSKSSGSGANNSQNSGSEDRVWFCKNFQRGNCTFSRDHYGQLNGENQLLKHICAKCWLTIKKQSPHSEQSNTCPLFNIQLWLSADIKTIRPVHEQFDESPSFEISQISDISFSNNSSVQKSCINIPLLTI